MLKLNQLQKLVKSRKRVGRGGNRGGTSGRGNKGQKGRSGSHGIGYGFEGGQTPLARRLPKRGFSNKRFGKKSVVVNVEDLERVFSSGDDVTIEKLINTGLIRFKSSLKGMSRPCVKLLGTGELTKKFTVHVDAISSSAQQAISKVGGIVHLLQGE